MNDRLPHKDLERNIRLFVWFRVLFNARFYYPVFAVFFTDMGLTISQFLWLNGIWALTIVLAEVPSGVLADLIGRRKLVIFSALSMAVEMLLLIVAPQNAGWGLFALCAVNRVLSGLAEAAASGADEALAYDSLKVIAKDQKVVEQRWDDVLVSTMRWRSIGMVVAMLVGGFTFDHEHMQAIFGEFPRIISLKLPIILCFLSALVCVAISFKLTDPEIALKDSSDKKNTQRPTIASLLSETAGAFRWVIHTKWVGAIIIAALLIDSTTRTFATIMSEYFRWIELPEYAFGILGASLSLSGWIVPLYVRPLARKLSPNANMLIAGSLAMTGLLGLSFLSRYLGVIAFVLTMMSLTHTGFLVSRYLNSDAPSEKRASILSVKSLALNLGYGIFSGLFAIRLTSANFGDSMPIMPLFLGTGMILWFAVTRTSGVQKANGTKQ